VNCVRKRRDVSVSGSMKVVVVVVVVGEGRRKSQIAPSDKATIQDQHDMVAIILSNSLISP